MLRLIIVPLIAAAALVLTDSTSAQTLQWDADASAPVNGGAGNWLGGTTWFNGATYQSWLDGSRASFGASAGTVTVNGPVSAAGLTFSVGGYTINGSSVLTLTSNTTAGGTQAIVTSGSGTTFISAPINLGAATGSATFSIGSGTTADISGKITSTNTEGINKTGSGTLILSGDNTYSGANTFTAGTVLVNNTAGSGTGTGTVTLSNSGTVLGGTGTISGAVTAGSSTVITGGTNGTVGALSLSSNVTFSGTAGYNVDISGGTSDKLIIGGALNLNSTTDQITFNGAADGTTSYVLATYGSVTGTFNTVNNLPSNYILFYGTNELDLIAVPEPSTWIGGALALGALGFSQRRRFVKRSRVTC
ncbi:MAG: fibronectin-binding autotransporter adhesin [Verrucomicrobiota bacterium]|jgi:autotransporter-associated beta strand protein